MMEFKAREKMLALVKGQGWELDPAATIVVGRYSRERVQDPYTFLRPAKHGGQWRIHLNYYNRGSTWSSGNYDGTLRDVKVTYIPIGGESKDGGYSAISDRHDRTFLLTNTDRSSGYRPTSHLWDVLGDEDAPKPLTLRQRAELLVKDPDLAVWLAAQARYEGKLRQQAQEERARIDQAERSRPLPITVDKHEWRRLTERVRSVAQALYGADGKSDLPELMVQAREAIAAVSDVIREES